MRAKLHAVREELRRRRHRPVPEQSAWLASVVRGYFAYHAVPTNIRPLGAFRFQVVRAWHRSLLRRGQRATGRIGHECTGSTNAGSRSLVSCTPGLGSASTSEPKAGAECGSSARSDLCGGRPDPLWSRAVVHRQNEAGLTPGRKYLVQTFAPGFFACAFLEAAA